MDNQSGILADIISNAIKSTFSELAQQQNYERTYYQQPITSANAVFSYGPIQQQRYEESAYIYPRSSRTTTISASIVPGPACDDCLMPSYLHQHTSYQPMKTSQTALVPSSLLWFPQVDFFRALGYTPQPLAHEDLFSILGYTPADITQIQKLTGCQGGVMESQSIPQCSQHRWVEESTPQPTAFQPHVPAHQLTVQQAGWPMVQELQQAVLVA
jgi:hypothetical protein